MIFAILVISVNSLSVFNCSQTLCTSTMIGNGKCDFVCNTGICNFDSNDTVNSNLLVRFSYSDCYGSCISTGCNLAHLANGICDSDCNSASCGWDLADCGNCSSGCYIANLTDKICSPSCNVSSCMYDNNACGWCNYGCFQKNLKSSKCISACNTTDCLMLNKNPCIKQCSPGCLPNMQNNNFCDQACNTSACGYDGGDCLCAPNCLPKMLKNTKCNDACNVPSCYFKYGLCGDCAANCKLGMLGDGKCNQACNVPDCFYDNNDCGCSPGCNSLYRNNAWDWDNNIDNFQNCLTLACLYNYGSSNFLSNGFLFREVFINQILSNDWTITAIQHNQECNNTSLQVYDSGISCSKTDACNNREGLYCVGMVKVSSTDCLRSDGTNCIICKGLMIMGTCVNTLSTCPFGYVNISTINEMFDQNNSTTICLREPTNYGPHNYRIFYVNSTGFPGICSGNGTENNPFLSLYYAMVNVYAAYTKIILQSGTFYFVKINNLPEPTPLINDPLNPLTINTFLVFNELWIIGYSSDDRPVVYWREKLQISSNALKIYIKNIIFNGEQILNNNCTSDYCLYCAIFILTDGYIQNQHFETISPQDYNNYPQNCSLYNDHILFSFINSSATFENVDFIGFRQQFKSLIYSESSLNLTNVNFNQIQPMPGGDVIKIECTTNNCDNISFIYNTGKVYKLNNGYEITNTIEFGNFFTANYIDSISFVKVSFSWNFVFSYVDSPNPAHLISSLSQIGTVMISGCTFDTNYVDDLIIIDVANLLYTDPKPDTNGVSTSYSQIHFQLVDCLFKNIYSSINFISYLMQKTIHNINITNIRIFNVAASYHGIIFLSNSVSLKLKDAIGYAQWFGNNLVTIPSRFINVNQVTIENSSTAWCAIQIINLPIITIYNWKANNIQDDSIFNADDVVYIFSSSPDIYLTYYPDSNQIGALFCYFIISLNSIYSLDMSNVSISNTSCAQKSGQAGINIESVVDYTTIANINIYNINSSSSKAIAFYLASCQGYAIITNVTIDTIQNNDASIFDCYKTAVVTISNFTLTNAIATNTAPVNIEQVITFTFSIIQFDNVASLYGNGGCLYTIGSNQGSNYINITNGNFTSCNSGSGSGGGLYIAGIS